MGDYEFYYTQDGSIGLYSYDDNDVYHSKYGAITEAWEKFIVSSDLTTRINKTPEIKVLDICYGVGYNTKALMSFVINKNKKYLKKKNFFKKIFSKFKSSETIYSDKTKNNKEKLSGYSETIECENLTKFIIDCFEINDELVRISPLLKTFLTPQEIFVNCVPKIFDCFETYWKIKNFLTKIAIEFDLKNKRHIRDLLNLKFDDEFIKNKKNYKIHKFVNYIIIDKLIDNYKKNYINKFIQKKLADKKLKKYFSRDLVKYSLFKQNFRYNLLTKLNLLSYLHNIYYDHLSKRYNNEEYKKANNLFDINFYIQDARKSVLEVQNTYDLIFLDAFTYSKAPELWTIDFIAELCAKLDDNGLIITYSNSALVRNTFIENNLFIGKIINAETGKSIGTIASKQKNLIKTPLSNYEMGLCATRAGIPYRDSTLSKSKEEILKNREIEFKNSDLMTSSQYMKLRERKKDASEE